MSGFGSAAPPTRQASDNRRYSVTAILLHWLIAALILTNLIIGWRMASSRGLAQFELFQLHKSIGITVFLFSLARLGWRLAVPPPPYPASLSIPERRGATVTHWLFYAAMIVIPMTGWVLVSASPLNIPTLLFDVVPWPHLPFVHDLAIPLRRAIEAWLGPVHVWLAWSLAALLLVHIAAALKHHFYDRDAVLSRMLPGFKRPRQGPEEIS